MISGADTPTSLADDGDIVQRLRERGWSYRDMDDAADEIETLRNEAVERSDQIERLRAELEAATRLLRKQGYNRQDWFRGNRP